MWQHHGVKVSRWMILLWCQDYSRIINNFTETLEPEIKGNVHADEVVVKTKGKKNWYWGAKDRKTKFKIAEKLTKRRTLSGAIHIFKKIRTGCKGIPKKIITGKLGHYAELIICFSTDCEEVVNLFTVFQLAIKNMGLNTTIIVLNGIMSVLSRDIKLQEDSKIQNRQKIS